MTVRERLVIGARLLVSIDAARTKREAPGLFTAVEREIIARELDELESEWLASRGPAVSVRPDIRRSER
jgi:hypothetical protein